MSLSLSCSLSVLDAAFYAPFTSSSVFPFVSARLLLFLLFPSSAPSASFSVSFSRSRPLSVSFLRLFRPGSTTDDVRLLCDGVADANPRRPLERRSIAEADAFLSSNHAESAGFGQVSRFFPSVRPGENPTK